VLPLRVLPGGNLLESTDLLTDRRRATRRSRITTTKVASGVGRRASVARTRALATVAARWRRRGRRSRPWRRWRRRRFVVSSGRIVRTFDHAVAIARRRIVSGLIVASAVLRTEPTRSFVAVGLGHRIEARAAVAARRRRARAAISRPALST